MTTTPVVFTANEQHEEILAGLAGEVSHSRIRTANGQTVRWSYVVGFHKLHNYTVTNDGYEIPARSRAEAEVIAVEIGVKTKAEPVFSERNPFANNGYLDAPKTASEFQNAANAYQYELMGVQDEIRETEALAAMSPAMRFAMGPELARLSHSRRFLQQMVDSFHRSAVNLRRIPVTA